MTDKHLKTTLEALGVPVARLLYKGNADTFITFQRVNATPAQHADDDGQEVERLYRVDLFSKDDYTELLDRLKQALEDADFYGLVEGPELFEDDTKYFHIPLDVNYLEE